MKNQVSWTIVLVGILCAQSSVAADVKVFSGGECTSVSGGGLSIGFYISNADDGLVQCPISRDLNSDAITDLDVMVGDIATGDGCTLYSYSLYGSLVDSELTNVNGTSDQVLDFDTVDAPGTQGTYHILCSISDGGAIFGVRYAEGV